MRAHICLMVTSAARKSPVRKRRAYEYLGTTSDGVRIIKPPRGRGNLTDAQIRQIVEGLLDSTGLRRKSEPAE